MFMYNDKRRVNKMFIRPRHARAVKSVSKRDLLAVIEKSKACASDTQNDVGPAVLHDFSDFRLHPTLTANIVAKGFTRPTPIQDQAVPAILKGLDVIGIAHTGTGKTAAFLIPLLEKITNDKNQRVLVLAPTRELAYQIFRELHGFSQGLAVRSALLIGGSNEWRQRQDMRTDPHFVIATPGRLREFIEYNYIRMSAYRNVVLDEADRMVDIGFIDEIKYVISLLPQERQSLFFSATITGNVSDMLANFVRNPVTVRVKSADAATTIRQDVIRVSPQEAKIEVLHDLLIRKEFSKVLIFGRTKWGVQRLSDELTKRGFRTTAIHGNKRQNQRQLAIRQFTRNEVQVLLATDVASRGLDIPDITHVINYDLPDTMEDYIHRIGRTGRAHKRGIALTFVE